MARPRTPIGAHGAIKLEQTAARRWRARTRFRFDDGALRQVERFAGTKAGAEAALKRALTELRTASHGDIRRETTLADLAFRFLESKADRAPRTVEAYTQTIRHLIIPKLGRLAVSEATTERLGRFIATVTRENGPGAAKACRAVLSGMLGLAARSDAVRVNPVREVGHIARKGSGAEAILLDDLPRLINAVQADERLVALDQADLIEFMANTGCRVGEACGLRWRSVNLEAGTATIEANVIRATGRGLVLQEHTKTVAGVRTIALPRPVLGMLGDRRMRGLRTELDLVFPTVLGNLRDPRNTSRDVRDARDRLGFPAVTTHSFRKTVATGLDQAGLSAREIAEYLGHENPSLTQDVYMAKNTGGKKAALAMAALTA